MEFINRKLTVKVLNRAGIHLINRHNMQIQRGRKLAENGSKTARKAHCQSTTEIESRSKEHNRSRERERGIPGVEWKPLWRPSRKTRGTSMESRTRPSTPTTRPLHRLFAGGRLPYDDDDEPPPFISLLHIQILLSAFRRSSSPPSDSWLRKQQLQFLSDLIGESINHGTTDGLWSVRAPMPANGCITGGSNDSYASGSADRRSDLPSPFIYSCLACSSDRSPPHGSLLAFRNYNYTTWKQIHNDETGCGMAFQCDPLYLATRGPLWLDPLLP